MVYLDDDAHAVNNNNMGGDEVTDGASVALSAAYARLFPFEVERERFLRVIGAALFGDALGRYVVVYDARYGARGRDSGNGELVELVERTFGTLAYVEKDAAAPLNDPHCSRLVGKRLAIFDGLSYRAKVDVQTLRDFSDPARAREQACLVVLVYPDSGLPDLRPCDSILALRRVAVPLRSSLDGPRARDMPEVSSEMVQAHVQMLRGAYERYLSEGGRLP